MKTIMTLLITLALILPVTACQHGAKHDDAIDYWTCSMHPQIHQDGPGNCPICGMTLVPVYKKTPEAPQNGNQSKMDSDQNGAGNSAPSASLPYAVISSERQQLIGVKKTEVLTKPLTRILRTFGRVAFDPDLAVAQKEYLEVLQSAPSLKSAARSRLMVLGMSAEEIDALTSSGNSASSYYLPQNKDAVWIYATVYQDDMSVIKPGMVAHIHHEFESEKSCEGVVRGIDPIIDPVTRALRARIQVTTPNVHLRPNAYVDVEIHIDLGTQLSVPKTAILDTGTRRLVFVVDGDQFKPRVVETGSDAEDDVVILSGLKAGEIVVSSATFLVDAESQLRGQIP